MDNIIIPNTADKTTVVKKAANWIVSVPVDNSPNTVVGNYPTPVMPSFPRSHKYG